MPISPGTRLGPYEIIAAIGAGGMGEVYRASDTRLDRVVAIKILPEHISNKPQARKRFEREARAVSSLNHPHICTLHDIGHQDGIDYLVMEYLDGDTLAHRLRKGPLPPDQVLQYAIQITDALDTAHRHGVVHRDLKPGNIMLTKSGAKLLDFRLAKVRASEAAASVTALPTLTTPLTGEGTILGTLQYMAPEQLEGKEADVRTDIFALGAVIYEMATGRKAFEGKSQASLISAIMSAEPPPISKLQPLTPSALDHVVRTCLAKDPDARWQDAHDVLVELKWAAQVSADQVPEPRARKPILLGWVAATAVCAVLLLALAVVHFREKSPETKPIRFSISPPEKVRFANLDVAGPALVSPDGSRLAFVGVDDMGKMKVWVRPLDALAAQPVAETEEYTYPFWSPDSRYLAFFAEGKLKKVSGGGGPAQIICDAPDPGGGSWAAGKDGGPGTIVFSPDRRGISRVSAAGGAPVQVTALDSSRYQMMHQQPEYLPDGRHFLYAARDRAARDSVFVGDLAAKPDPRNARILLDGVARASYATPGYLLFVREHNLMAQAFDAQRLELSGEPWVLADQVHANIYFNTSDFSVSANGVLAWRTLSAAGVQQLAWFDRSGKQVPGLDERELNGAPSLSPDGKRIAWSRPDATQPGSSNIWIRDLVRSSPSRLTFGIGLRESPIWYPDGRRIVFSDDRPPDYGMYWKDSSGVGNAELLLRTAHPSTPKDCSRDGRFIVFAQLDPRTKWDIWVLPLVGDRKPVPLLQTEFNEFDAQFSYDGHWIAYSSDESGREEVYVRSFIEGGSHVADGKWLVSTAGGNQPVWRRDGKELFYRALDGKLMAVPVKIGTTFAAGLPVALVDMRDSRYSSYAASADGQRFLIHRVLEKGASGPVNVCLNWLAGAKK